MKGRLTGFESWGGVWASEEAAIGGLDLLMVILSSHTSLCCLTTSKPGFGYGGALGTFWGPVSSFCSISGGFLTRGLLLGIG